jgi:hypothetical protein
MATTIPVSTGKMKKMGNNAQLAPPALSRTPLVMKEAYLLSDGGNKFTAPERYKSIFIE